MKFSLDKFYPSPYIDVQIDLNICDIVLIICFLIPLSKHRLALSKTKVDLSRGEYLNSESIAFCLEESLFGMIPD